MANARVCDRCTRIMAELTHEEKLKRKYALGVYNEREGASWLDLCPTCYSKLLEFMNEEEED